MVPSNWFHMTYVYEDFRSVILKNDFHLLSIFFSSVVLIVNRIPYFKLNDFTVLIIVFCLNFLSLLHVPVYQSNCLMLTL